tara:strand:- start:59 stop:778 length:720 start_codon:yes stop_codon:yes gene_type:complete
MNSERNDLPLISVLTPTYNRSKFLPLFLNNLKKQSYPLNKLEIVIDDDGTEPFTDNIEQLRKDLSPSKLIYFKSKTKRTIGEKRNNLVKLATSKILINLDDDDIYNPAYIEHSYFTLKDKKCGLVGSNDMLFCYPKKDFKMTAIHCAHKVQIHEATMCYSKKYFRSMNGFLKNSRGEGVNMVQNQDKNVGLTDITLCMICVAHDGNSVNKEQFDNPDHCLNMNYEGIERNILKQILEIK